VNIFERPERESELHQDLVDAVLRCEVGGMIVYHTGVSFHSAGKAMCSAVLAVQASGIAAPVQKVTGGTTSYGHRTFHYMLWRVK